MRYLISDFRIRRPAFAVSHEESVAWLAAAHAKAESVIQARDAGPDAPEFQEDAFRRSMERYIARFGCGPESLESRGHDLEDFMHREWSRMLLFPLDKDPHGAGMDARMQVFTAIADKTLAQFYSGGEAAPAEIIHVSCTGYVAPSAVQKLVVAKGWQETVGVTHAYHMGCYASLPALRMATAFLATPRLAGPPRVAGPDSPALPMGRVDIVHTEACTLHLDPTRHNPEQLVVQSLFADGHIRYSVEAHLDADAEADADADRKTDAVAHAAGKASGRGLRYIGVREELIPGSLDAMGWVLGDHGMRMILAREVPELIAGALRGFLKRLWESAGVDSEDALRRGLFAIHPGGPRIIDKVAALLDLAPSQVAASRAVLKAYGNMSSATLPHVWAAMDQDPAIATGTLITSMAFGPGLTVYGALLRKA